MERYDVVILGAGASGLMAARQLRAHGGKGLRALVLEGNQKIGKKLLVTGNGRCNLTNLRVSPEHYHGDVEEAARVLSAYPAQRVLAEFEEMGLFCRADSEGRVYPYSGQALSVLRTLERPGKIEVPERTDFAAKTVLRERDGFLLQSGEGEEIWANRCILACGGAASPAHSMGGLGYELAKALGHTVTPLSPSLTPLKTDSKVCRALKGMRCKAETALYQNEKKLYEESGEVIFGEDRLSGICVFNLSARLREAGGGSFAVGLDLLETMELPALRTYLDTFCRKYPALPAWELFSGLLNLRVGQELAKAAGLGREKSLGVLNARELDRAAALAKDWRFPIAGPCPWESAQVTAGGVPLREVDLKTMESKLCPGLYLTGELLDVDGDCGGYNLHWAWATGMAAGKAAAKGEGLC